MFEKASSFLQPAKRDVPGAREAGDVMIGSARGQSEGSLASTGDALRALDWNELTTRLNAARELRLLLRRDASTPIGSHSSSFGDAAARYFSDETESERPVNLDALEPRKSSQCIVSLNEKNAARGDARDSE